MSLITFPRSLPSALGIAQAKFRLVPVSEVSRTRGGGSIAKNLGPALWMAEFHSTLLDFDDFGTVRAWLDSLSNTQTFYGYDVLREYPWAYRNGWEGGFDGTCTLDDVASNGVEVDLTDLPANFVFSAGDYIAFDYGSSSRALHRIQANVTADGSGDVTVEVRPLVRTGWVTNTTVDLHKPAAKMYVDAINADETIDANGYGTVSFSAIQAL